MLRGADHPCYDIVVLAINSFHQDKERKAVKHPWVLGIQAVMATTTVTGIYL